MNQSINQKDESIKLSELVDYYYYYFKGMDQDINLSGKISITKLKGGWYQHHIDIKNAYSCRLLLYGQPSGWSKKHFFNRIQKHWSRSPLLINYTSQSSLQPPSNPQFVALGHDWKLIHRNHGSKISFGRGATSELRWTKTRWFEIKESFGSHRK